MPDQAHGLRNLMYRMTEKTTPPRERPAPLVVVVGAKRGVGTTTVAVNIAATLAHQGRRVLWVEGHLHRGDAASLAGRGNPLPHHALDVSRGGLQDQLTSLRTQAELIVLDAGAGANPVSSPLAPAADQLLVVTTCDAIAVMDAYATIKLLCRKQRPTQLSLATNQATDADLATDVYDRVAQSSLRFLALPLAHAGSVPSCDSLAASSTQPVVLETPTSPASRGLKRLAMELDGRIFRAA